MATRPLQNMTTEELRTLRDTLTRRATPKAKALPLYEHATTHDVLRLIGIVEADLLTLRACLGQWQSNLDRLGADELARQDRQRRGA